MAGYDRITVKRHSSGRVEVTHAPDVALLDDDVLRGLIFQGHVSGGIFQLDTYRYRVGDAVTVDKQACHEVHRVDA